ncbi:MAG: hypothetical protein Q8M11_15630 [Sulfuritalea sp.]|jgi:hypothetical protein|nr:hypothetical protein [Sulfuritalea sp.]MDP1981529.1 hypothetical protein [Sulfuritalea sp.]
MNADYADMVALFRQLTDEELLSRYRSKTLIDTAAALAAEEIRRRGLDLPMPELCEPEDREYAGDYELVARFLNPTDAYVLCSCLKMAGVPALVADAELVQTNSLWAVALGGARLLVPALHVGEAREVIAAFNRGEYALPDDDE